VMLVCTRGRELIAAVEWLFSANGPVTLGT